MTPTLKHKGRSLFFCKDKGDTNMIIILSLLIIGIFNLIPIGNLDGGRIFRILMQS